jgi:hypothetical protein
MACRNVQQVRVIIEEPEPTAIASTDAARTTTTSPGEPMMAYTATATPTPTIGSDASGRNSASALSNASTLSSAQQSDAEIAEFRRGERDLDVVGGHLDNYLRLSFYQGGAQETFHYLHRCSYLRFGASFATEAYVCCTLRFESIRTTADQ